MTAIAELTGFEKTFVCNKPMRIMLLLMNPVSVVTRKRVNATDRRKED